MPIVEIPPQFRCPITQDLFEDPVKTYDGQIYERKAIETWFKSNDTSPLTNLTLLVKTLMPCHDIKAAIETFIKQAHICTKEELIKAVEQGDVAAINQLNYFENYLELKFDYSEKSDDRQKEKNYTLFHLTVKKQNVEMLKFLLSEVKNLHFIADNNKVGYTPLTLAARINNLEMLKLLHQTKVDINGKVTRGFMTPLVYAILNNNVEAVKLLLAAGANPNAKNSQEVSAPSCLHIAASKGHLEFLNLLLEFKANINVTAKHNNHENGLYPLADELLKTIKQIRSSCYFYANTSLLNTYLNFFNSVKGHSLLKEFYQQHQPQTQIISLFGQGTVLPKYLEEKLIPPEADGEYFFDLSKNNLL